MPAQSASFATGGGRLNRWIIPAALASVAPVAVILLIVLVIGAGFGGR